MYVGMQIRLMCFLFKTRGSSLQIYITNMGAQSSYILNLHKLVVKLAS